MRFIAIAVVLGLAMGGAEARDENAAAIAKAREDFAAMPKPPMTKIISRVISEDIPAESFAAKPKTIFMAGSAFARLEEEPDPEQGIHGLIIMTEPDSWMINLFDHTGKHLVDGGPTFEIHLNVISMAAPGSLSKLEFGHELDFFKSQKATSRGVQVIDGQECEVYALNEANYRLVFFVRADTHVPFLLEITEDNKKKHSIKYLSYETNLPFDAALFSPPRDIAITEAKQGQ